MQQFILHLAGFEIIKLGKVAFPPFFPSAEMLTELILNSKIKKKSDPVYVKNDYILEYTMQM